MKGRPVALIVLDGWGLSPVEEGNAIRQARTPTIDRLELSCAHAELSAHGRAVGLRDDQMGNSNVGHLNLGAGRVVYQDLTRIDLAIQEGDFFQNEVLREAMRARRLHLLGLLSDGGVHSHISHLLALLTMARREGVPEVWVHAFLDGRDTPPESAPAYLEILERELAPTEGYRLGSIAGRYYAMDRDRRWERVRESYEVLVRGGGLWFPDWRKALAAARERGETDEFVRPSRIGEFDAIGEDDGAIFFNFRADRARELSRALAEASFTAFERPEPPRHLSTFTLYDAEFPLPAAFPPVEIRHGLGEVVSEAGLRQFRVAETEKYAHVTYFFNGGREEPFPGEDRLLIPSPKVATYDLQPEMSAPAVTEAAVEAIRGGVYDLLVMNYANADMVGHTGILTAAIAAVEAVDDGLGRVVRALEEAGGVGLVVADHGNAEEMYEPGSRSPHTAHTLNPVPIYLVGRLCDRYALESGTLADVAPTLLELLEIPPPPEMTGHSLLKTAAKAERTVRKDG